MGGDSVDDWQILLGILYMLFSMVVLATAFSAAASRANEGNPLDKLQAKVIELFNYPSLLDAPVPHKPGINLRLSAIHCLQRYWSPWSDDPAVQLPPHESFSMEKFEQVLRANQEVDGKVGRHAEELLAKIAEQK